MFIIKCTLHAKQCQDYVCCVHSVYAFNELNSLQKQALHMQTTGQKVNKICKKCRNCWISWPYLKPQWK